MIARSILSISMAVCLVASLQATASAQTTVSNVAVVDVAAVFKADQQFNGKLEAMKEEVEVFQADLQREQQAIANRAERLNQYDPGSVEYKNLEVQLTNESAKLTVIRNQKNREFLEREASLYYETYLRVQQELNAMANEMGVTLILRVDNKEPDVSNRQSVLQTVNRNVVYQRGDRDITAKLVDRINQRR